MTRISSSYTASGLTTGRMPGMSLSVRSMNRADRIIRRSVSQERKKQLNYNPREISSAILRANKSQSAGRIAVQAKGKLANLLKCKGTGQYNESELNMAIIHAKRMVRCAQMKTRNLRQEERSRKQYENEAKAELRQEKSEAKARAARKERELEQKYNLERMQRVQKEKSQKRDLMRQKKFHRSQERSKLNEADMDYLKQQIRELHFSENNNAAVNIGVVLDLSAQAVQLSEVQLEQQLEQETAQELAALEQAAGVSGIERAAESAVPRVSGIEGVAVGVNVIV